MDSLKAAQAKIIYEVARYAYKKLLRGVLLSAIDDPDKKWDNWAMLAADAVFQYKRPGR